MTLDTDQEHHLIALFQHAMLCSSKVGTVLKFLTKSAVISCSLIYQLIWRQAGDAGLRKKKKKAVRVEPKQMAQCCWGHQNNSNVD